jgi:hypothetical protein
MDPADLRISDTEREDAMRMLGEHMSVGRLGIDEYGERSAKVTAAKTRREVLELFTDLPDPRPVYGVTAPVPPPAARPAAGVPAHPGGDDRPAGARVLSALVPLSALVALVLFLTVIHVWWIFLLPAAMAVIGGAIFGDDWRDERKEFHRRMRDDRRNFHREMRDRRRQLRRDWD